MPASTPTDPTRARSTVTGTPTATYLPLPVPDPGPPSRTPARPATARQAAWVVAAAVIAATTATLTLTLALTRTPPPAATLDEQVAAAAAANATSPYTPDPVLMAATGLSMDDIATDPTYRDQVLVNDVCPDGCATRQITVSDPARVIDTLFTAGYINETGTRASCARQVATAAGCLISDGRHVAWLTVAATDPGRLVVTRVDED